MSKEKRDQAVYIRMTEAEIARLDAVAERLPFLSRSALAREAMRLGLDAIERQGLEVLAGTQASKPKQRRGKR